MIPTSAHGTNPASANMAGFNVEYINTDKVGGIDLEDLQKKVCYIAYEFRRRLCMCFDDLRRVCILLVES